METEITRRPLKTRETRWAASLARCLASKGIRPNFISLFSIVFSGFSAALFWQSSQFTSSKIKAACLVGAAACIQLRLLCNLLDGMVAVEGGFRTKSGEIYNDLPDRISDTLTLLSAGCAIPNFAYGSQLGWLASLLAVFTAYVRVLGGACGIKQDFCGPMAKPHRMATMTVASLLAGLETLMKWPERCLLIGMIAVIGGSVLTIIRRASRIVEALESK